jgi:hypothetical protein
LRHFLCELTTQGAGQLTLEIIDALLPSLAFFDDERDALWSLWCAAREGARGPCEKCLYATEVVEQARACEEVVSEGRG